MKFKQSQFLAKPYSKCGDYCAKEKGRVSAFLNVIQSFAPIGKTVTLKRENTLLLNPTSKNTYLHYFTCLFSLILRQITSSNFICNKNVEIISRKITICSL